MKKIFVSAGLAALGAVSIHADVYAPDVTANDASKIWSVSGTLRGFYDDNYTTAHNDADGKRASWGFEASPSVSVIVPLQQTELGLRYTYGLYYYQDRENIDQNPIDQTHEADLWVDHAFSERWEAKVQDTFISAQDPQLSSSPTATPYRVEGNNIQNAGILSAHTEWSMLFSSDVGYQNNFVHYENGVYASLLNEDGHLIWVNLNYQYLPNLTFLVGYQFGLDNYLAGDNIGTLADGTTVFSDSRDMFSNYGYVGAQYAFAENLTASAHIGAQVIDNYNLPSGDTQSSTQVDPYADVAITYTYLPGDYVQLGFTQSASPTFDSSVAGSSITLYQEASVVYASINHQITPSLLASLIGRYQYATDQGGTGGSQDYYSFGVNLSYAINPFLSAEIGYNYDYADNGPVGSGLLSYARNREYIGITATY